MSILPEEVNEALEEIATYEHDGEVVIEMILLHPVFPREVTRLVQGIQEGQRQHDEVDQLNDVMSNYPEDWSVDSCSEVGKEWMLQFLLHFSKHRRLTINGFNISHLHNLLIPFLYISVFPTQLIFFWIHEDDVGIPEQSVHHNDERNNEEEEKGEG